MPSPQSLSAALLGLALVCPAIAQGQGLELGQVLIGADNPSDEDQGIEDAKARLDQVPGGTNVVDMRRPLQGRV
ncbi:MAG: TonB-dependent receptor, partial [Pseudomonas sp.]